AEEQVKRPAACVAADKARERPDAGPRTDQDQRRPAPARTETGVGAQESAHRVTRLQRRELAGAEAAGMFLHDDLDEAVAAPRGERVEPRVGASFGQNADQVARVEPGEPAPEQPLPERGARKREAEDGG